MNVIISNLNGSKFNNLDVDIIKSISGEFSAEEIVQTFSNFFFNKMFLDITSIEGYENVNNLKTISVGLDVSKIILLLADDPVINSDYISKLISMGIYNFARTEDELKYLYDNPNSYRDVAHLQMIMNNDNSNTIVNDSINSSNTITSDASSSSARVIGFKNVTYHAGATSLIYMLKNQLARDYSVVALEVNKNDFMFFNDKNMISCSAIDVASMVLKFKNLNIILIDLNEGAVGEEFCDDIIYLMESSTIAINKAFMLNKRCFEKVSDKIVVLNKSLLDDRDISLLERESGVKFFHVLPNLNDRLSNHEELFPLLEKLGLYRRSN